MSPMEKKSKRPSLENIDVEMEVEASVVTKPNTNDENNDSTTSTSSPKKKNSKKRKKQSISPDASQKKTKKDPNRPEYPKVGYVRYMYVRREELRNQFPDMHHLEVTKKIGEEWTNMSEEKKAPYLDAAKEDKIRYKMEMKEYTKNLEKPTSSSQKTNSSKNKNKKKQKRDTSAATDSSFEENHKKSKKKTSITNGTSKSTKFKSKLTNGEQQNESKQIVSRPSSPAQIESTPIYGDIPIFTDQFLEHNRQMESELKKLRKLNTDYEQQNAVLEKHVENVRNGLVKARAEISDLGAENEKLTKYLDILKHKLAHQLRNLSIPSEPNGANIENIDKYMKDLYEMVKNDSHGPASLNKAKDLLRKVDLNVDLKAFHSIS